MGNVEAYGLGGYDYIDQNQAPSLINSEILLFLLTFYKLFKLEVKNPKFHQPLPYHPQ